MGWAGLRSGAGVEGAGVGFSLIGGQTKGAQRVWRFGFGMDGVWRRGGPRLCECEGPWADWVDCSSGCGGRDPGLPGCDGTSALVRRAWAWNATFTWVSICLRFGFDCLRPPRTHLPPQSGLTPQQMVAREFALVYQPYNIAAVNMIQVR